MSGFGYIIDIKYIGMDMDRDIIVISDSDDDDDRNRNMDGNDGNDTCQNDDMDVEQSDRNSDVFKSGLNYIFVVHNII